MARGSALTCAVRTAAIVVAIVCLTGCLLPTGATELTAGDARLNCQRQLLTANLSPDAFSNGVAGGEAEIRSSEETWSDVEGRSLDGGRDGPSGTPLRFGVSREDPRRMVSAEQDPRRDSRQFDNLHRPADGSMSKRVGERIGSHGVEIQTGSRNTRIEGRALAGGTTPHASTSAASLTAMSQLLSSPPSKSTSPSSPSSSFSHLPPSSSPKTPSPSRQPTSPSSSSSSSQSPAAARASSSSAMAVPAAWGAGRMQLVTVPSATAKCLDGSPAAYYLRKGTGSGAKKWLIYFHGGGWCTTGPDCQQRAKTFRGSSRFWPKPSDANFTRLMNEYRTQFAGILSADAVTNPVFSTWNMAVLMYCDGGCYMGYKGRAKVGGSHVFYSGRRIVMLLLEDMLKNRGLSTASSVLITGCSAGGMGVAVSCDWMASRLPSTATVKCAIDAGYFLDEPDLAGRFSLRSMLQRMMIAHWSDAAFNPQCVKAYSRAEKWRCIFAASTLLHTNTPVFVVNSAFDLAALSIGLSKGNVGTVTGSSSANDSAPPPCYHSARFQACPKLIRKYVGHHSIVLRNSVNALLQDRKGAKVPFGALVSNSTSHCTMAYNDWSVPDANGVRLRDVVAAWFQQ